ncbi:NADH dehydrogenase [ubiquinone] 1 alpha subcomplex assembly factor 3 isoform X4 [Ahaetulla prasina]|uniref:NADH dehydrogenase [ubiquinone] 1 alpha subcomplex assembly factor 3 isoform X4 n=1 Tax=Ahaetulla prasina TaxID=499056 RepID=UPI0026496766|nr:NADH dehydrogenase [ubiquinone] 1 alpha subcomplex assembly factor 3 isoform X4 [Ahaetulla prasina]
MAALRSLGSTLVWRARPAFARSFRQSQRNHRLTPSDDELLQKTTLHQLERESPNIMFIENYTNYGFSINGNTVVGPCAVLPQAILQWNVGTYKDIIEGSLALFYMLEPKIGRPRNCGPGNGSQSREAGSGCPEMFAPTWDCCGNTKHA